MDAQARRDFRPRRRSLGIEGFRLEGLVEDQPVTALWSGGKLECDPGLLDRAMLVVALGETFGGGDLRPVTASLTDGPTAAFLTLMRAMSVVHRLEFTHQLPRRPFPAGDATH